MTNHLTILNYHGFESRPNEYEWLGEEVPYVLDAVQFSAQMQTALDREFKPAGLAGLKDWKEGKSSGKNVMVTFDDGLKSHGEIAAPILEKKGMKGLFFIPVELVGSKGHMDWDELKLLTRHGFEIGSHGLRHIPLTGLPEKELREEFDQSKKILEDKLGMPVKSFSIPRGYYNEAMRDIARRAGYEFLFTSTFDINRSDADFFELKRMVVKRSTSSAQFLKMLEGDLGFRRTWEKMKERVRGSMPPFLYDAMAAAKRAVRS